MGGTQLVEGPGRGLESVDPCGMKLRDILYRIISQSITQETSVATKELNDSLPLKPQWFHILLALSEGTRHGSGIVRSVLQETDGKLRLWPATLYGSLDELSVHGWIEEVSDPAERPRGESEKKRFYRITPDGAHLLAAEAERLKALATSALSRLAADAATP